MDQENTGLLHHFLFAVFAIVLVYCGEQVRAKPIGVSSWLMRSSAIMVAVGVASLTISFIPAAKSNEYKKWCDAHENDLKQLSAEGAPTPDKLKQVNASARAIGQYGCKQNHYDLWNNIFTLVAVSCMPIAVILFTIGVCLL